MCTIVVNDEVKRDRKEVRDSDRVRELLNIIRHNIYQNNISRAIRFEELLNGKVSKVPVYANPTRVWYEFRTKDKECLKIYLDEHEYGEANLEDELNRLIELRIKYKRQVNLKRFACGVILVGGLFGLVHGLVKAGEAEWEQHQKDLRDWKETHGIVNEYSDISHEGEIDITSSHKR